jgi:hypothetical protein
MIHEFAVDPVAINNWQNFRYVIDDFGVENGKLISRFPRSWKSEVYEACSACRDVERKRIEARLIDVDNLLVSRGREYIRGKTWFENAESQHSIKPFRAIISVSNPSNNPSILIAEKIDKKNNPLWKVPRERKVRRSAKHLAECASLLLMISKEILFVDPHFDFVDRRYDSEIRRFYNTMVHLIELSIQDKKPTRLELHVKRKYEDGVDPEDTLKKFQNLCHEKLAPLIPQGSSMKVYIWDQKNIGDKLHPRYILTEFGGIRFEVGLDEGRKGETTDVSLLDHSHYEDRWRDYQKETAAFDPVGEPVVVEGKKTQRLTE